VSVALVVQHAMRKRRIFNCGLSGNTYFPHYLVNGTILGKKVIGHNMRFDFPYEFYLKYFSL
jgi:hypothetical protein